MLFSWEEQLAIGKEWELAIDKWARATFGIQVDEVSLEFDKVGIDRIWTKPDGISITVEYKSDTRGHQTGNIFLETLANDVRKKKGWAYTSQAQYLLYLIIGSGQIIFCPMSSVKDNILKWIRNRDEKVVQNKDYCAHGFPIPIKQIVKDTKAKVYWMNGRKA